MLGTHPRLLRSFRCTSVLSRSPRPRFWGWGWSGVRHTFGDTCISYRRNNLVFSTGFLCSIYYCKYSNYKSVFFYLWQCSYINLPTTPSPSNQEETLKAQGRMWPGGDSAGPGCRQSSGVITYSPGAANFSELAHGLLW